jgi:hypothetical protein
LKISGEIHFSAETEARCNLKVGIKERERLKLSPFHSKFEFTFGEFEIWRFKQKILGTFLLHFPSPELNRLHSHRRQIAESYLGTALGFRRQVHVNIRKSDI